MSCHYTDFKSISFSSSPIDRERIEIIKDDEERKTGRRPTTASVISNAISYYFNFEQKFEAQ